MRQTRAAAPAVAWSRKLRELYVSGTSRIAEGNLSPLNDRRNLPVSLGVLQHPVQFVLAGQDIYVFERDLFLCVVLTGLRRVGSSIFAKDQDFLLHMASSFGYYLKLWIPT